MPDVAPKRSPDRTRKLKSLSATVLRADADAPFTKESFLRLVQRAPTNTALKAIAERRADLDNLASWRLPDGYLDWQSGPLMRQPKEIALSPQLGELLYKLAFARKPRLIVEAGSGFGISGSYLAAALAARRTGFLLSFEAGEHFQVASQTIERTWSNTLVLHKEFETLPANLSQRAEIDFAFIDALHHGEIVFRQIRTLLGFCASGAIVVVDDAYQRGQGALLSELRDFAKHRNVSFAAAVNRRFFIFAVR